MPSGFAEDLWRRKPDHDGAGPGRVIFVRDYPSNTLQSMIRARLVFWAIDIIQILVVEFMRVFEFV